MVAFRLGQGLVPVFVRIMVCASATCHVAMDGSCSDNFCFDLAKQWKQLMMQR